MGREKGAKMTAQPVKSTPEEPTLAPNIDLWKEHAHSLWDNGVEGNDGIDDEDTLPADCLGRELYAWRYTELLKGAKSQKLVLEVNGGYGTGKTYFLRQWANSINAIYKGANGGKESLGIAIYYSAWDVDFHQGALLPLMTEINESFDAKKSKLLKGYEKGKGALINLIREKAKNEIEKVKSSSFQLMGKAFDTAMIANGMPPLASGFLRRFKKNLEERGQNTLNSYEEQKDQIYAFKKQLKALSDKLGGITIFVDELERCRPTHAVETLEIIKHLLNVKGIHVVIGTDRSQLKCTIENLYGQNMDGDEYLRRFIDLEMTLPDPDYYEFAKYLANSLPVTDREGNRHDYWLGEKESEDHYNILYGKQAFIDSFARISSYSKRAVNEKFTLHPEKPGRLRQMVKAMERVKFILISNTQALPYYPRALAAICYMQTFNDEKKAELASYSHDSGASSEVKELVLSAIEKNTTAWHMHNWTLLQPSFQDKKEIRSAISRQTRLSDHYHSEENILRRNVFIDSYPHWDRSNQVETLKKFCELKGTDNCIQAMIKTIQNGETLAEDSSGKP
jgi:hypothetical protein